MKGTFLKWAGGKTWFALAQSDIFPKNYNKYIEPFLGSGAVFFYLKPDEALLSDINQELITTYCSIKNEVDDVCRYLDIHSKKHSKDYYYKIRETKTRKNYTTAARMIYLNKACFNGIYRVNKSGYFNVPIGSNRKIFFEKKELINTANLLKNASIKAQDFQTTIEEADKNDFLFCDPPYAVMNENGRFVSYTADLFTWEDQVRLSISLGKARKKGVKILMTNVDHPAVRELYLKQGGFELSTVERFCKVSSNTKGRKNYQELIVSANLE
ncbi:DNA adenine methylase [Eubacterium aggregans]|uniref:Site-specific DNA-methyltransferase (adenine-specific) n=1 Tax=Eubacterium aggregans TaxID=81409 RepID=A0A1H4CK23_9FIRM|nr:Dam family site-specific DNA-(adenine-N6)-methyltransferase [Eubacterium aggregans]SEA60775.1 DNA adenine methylase [Eubacterium aggregans]